MDHIVGISDLVLNVETQQVSMPELDVETDLNACDQESAPQQATRSKLNVETKQLLAQTKPCSVKLVSLETTLFPDSVPKRKLDAADLPPGQHFTR